MTSEPSVTTIIEGLKQGDPQAAELLWVKYFDKLVAAARRRLGSAPKRAYDEEDVAVSVFASLCRGAERGNFSKLTDREDLWALLLAITRQRAVDRIRHENRDKRGGGEVRGESVFVKATDGTVVLGIDQLIREEVTPDLLVELEERQQQLLAVLTDDNMRKVALLRMEGYSVKEIANEFGYTTRWVERKLELIRKKWTRVLLAETDDV